MSQLKHILLNHSLRATLVLFVLKRGLLWGHWCLKIYIKVESSGREKNPLVRPAELPIDSHLTMQFLKIGWQINIIGEIFRENLETCIFF